MSTVLGGPSTGRWPVWRRLTRRLGIVTAIGVALLMMLPTQAVYGFGQVLPSDGSIADFDARTGKVAPSAAQINEAGLLGAHVEWNAFGTPHSLISYGGYLAALLTALRPVRWLGLRVPALYKDSDWKTPKLALRQAQDLERYRRQRIRPDENRALAACAAFRGDVLIVESGQDTLIPHEVTESYREASKQAKSLTYRVIDKADHALSDPACSEAYTSILVNWITEMIAGWRAPDVDRQHLVLEGAEVGLEDRRVGGRNVVGGLADSNPVILSNAKDLISA